MIELTREFETVHIFFQISFRGVISFHRLFTKVLLDQKGKDERRLT